MKLKGWKFFELILECKRVTKRLLIPLSDRIRNTATPNELESTDTLWSAHFLGAPWLYHRSGLSGTGFLFETGHPGLLWGLSVSHKILLWEHLWYFVFVLLQLLRPPKLPIALHRVFIYFSQGKRFCLSNGQAFVFPTNSSSGMIE